MLSAYILSKHLIAHLMLFSLWSSALNPARPSISGGYAINLYLSNTQFHFNYLRNSYLFLFQFSNYERIRKKCCLCVLFLRYEDRGLRFHLIKRNDPYARNCISNSMAILLAAVRKWHVMQDRRKYVEREINSEMGSK